MTGIFLIVLSCVLWALDTLIRYPLVERQIDPLTIVFYEHVVLTLIFSLGLFPAIKRMGELRLSDVLSFFIVGGLGSAIATMAFTQSFIYLNPSMVILLQKLQPIVVIVLARLVLKEEIPKPFLIWGAICLFGGILVSFPDIERLYHLVRDDFKIVISHEAIQGFGLVGISILGWGSATVFGKRLSIAGFDTKAILGGRFLMGLLVLIPFIQWNKWSEKLIMRDMNDYVRVLVMVLISGALAMYLYYQGLKRLPAKTTAIAEMFFPFFAIIANWLFLDKQLTELQLVGGGLLIIGSLVIQLKKY
jgi:drug/metabolite transporter (DMT)-like permease